MADEAASGREREAFADAKIAGSSFGDTQGRPAAGYEILRFFCTYSINKKDWQTYPRSEADTRARIFPFYWKNVSIKSNNAGHITSRIETVIRFIL
ncbi:MULTISPECIES: hypothetical protein [Paenibacillus]|uniref:Uncharacterized protein n=1 Tax=Paenibacillus residui TaxID=629724 RepID=A0ABW3DF82_9BACL